MLHRREIERFAGMEFRERALLQTWFSPSFPIGGFAYSHGLESAASTGRIKDETALLGWIGDLLQHGSIANDMVLAACAWRATGAPNWQELREVTELASALHASAERQLESLTQGASFLEAISAAWPCENLKEAVSHCGEPGSTAYAVAAGLVSAAHGLRLTPTLEAYALAFVSSQVSAAIRLGSIGQTAAQRIIAALLPAIRKTVGQASIAKIEDIGSASFSADLHTMEHETQYTRLFRT